jgi:hypothetical protein
MLHKLFSCEAELETELHTVSDLAKFDAVDVTWLIHPCLYGNVV